MMFGILNLYTVQKLIRNHMSGVAHKFRLPLLSAACMGVRTYRHAPGIALAPTVNTNERCTC